MTLEVVAGPDAGVQKRIRGGRMIIGRGEGTDFRLTDAAVSRRHVEIVVASRGAVLRDLGSGNGSRVNGKRVDEATLVHGDEIQIGQTRLAFVDESAAIAAAPAGGDEEPAETGNVYGEEGVDDAPELSGTAMVSVGAVNPAARKKVVLVGAGGLLLVLVLILALAPRRGGSPEAGASAQAGVIFEEAKRLIGDRKFKDAYERLKQIEAAAPNLPDLAQYLTTTKAAMEADKKLARAQALMKAGDFVQARSTLKTIPEQGLAFMEDDGIVNRLLEECATGEVEQTKKAIDQLLAAGEPDKAKALIDKLPSSMQIGVQAQIEAALKRRETEERAAEQRDQRDQASRRDARVRRAEADVDRILAPAVRKIDTGEFDRAERELERIAKETPNPEARRKAKQVKKALPDLATNYREGMRRYQGANVAQAARPLEKALYLYETLDLDGRLDADIKPRLSQALYLHGKGNQASAEYGEAAKDFKKALVVDPKNDRAKAALKELSNLARTVFMDAYAARRTDPDYARKKFKEVIEIVPSSDEAHQKAQRWLRVMDGEVREE